MDRDMNMIDLAEGRITRRFVRIGLGCLQRPHAEWAALGNELNQQLAEHV